MGIVINLTHNGNGNVTTVIVTTTWGRELAAVTEASTIEAITAAMRSVERRIAAKAEDLTTRRNVRKNKMAKWKFVRNALNAAYGKLADTLVDEIKQQPQAAVWVNKFDGDVAPRDIPVPGDWRHLRGGVSVRTWPIAQVGDTITHNEQQWRVVANFVYGGNGGRYVEVFSVYAIIPA